MRRRARGPLCIMRRAQATRLWFGFCWSTGRTWRRATPGETPCIMLPVGGPEAHRAVAAGADPNALDRAGYTPLAWARERDHRHEVPGATVAVLELVSALAGTSQ